MPARARVIPQTDSGSTDIHPVYPACTLHLNTLTQVLPCLSRCTVSQNTYPAERSSPRARYLIAALQRQRRRTVRGIAAALSYSLLRSERIG